MSEVSPNQLTLGEILLPLTPLGARIVESALRHYQDHVRPTPTTSWDREIDFQLQQLIDALSEAIDGE